MFKKIAQNVTTFLILTGLYFAYARGFVLVRRLIGLEPPVLVNREVLRARKSATALEKTRLAEVAFGAGHWSTDPDLPISYYYADRGYWIYSKKLEKLNNGQRILLRPFAMIWKSRDSEKLQTAVSDEAVLDMDQPLGVSKKKGDQSGHVVHAKLEGNVRLRDNKGTLDPIDDLRIGDPLPYIEFDDRKLQIYSDKRVVVYDGIEHKVEGTGMVIDLRPNDPAPPPRPGVAAAPAPSTNSGFNGAKTIWLNKDVVVSIRDVGASGVLPGSTRSPGSEPVPLRVRSDGPMRIDLPRPHLDSPRLVGPPAPAEPTVVQFQRNVEVQRGSKEIDQLNGDTLLLLFRQGDPKPNSTNSTVGSLELRWLKASGHAVWLQSQAQEMVARGNELIYERPGPNKPDKIYFRSTATTRVWVEKINRDVGRKISSIDAYRAFDITIYDDGKPGGPQSVVARGPGMMESRPARDQEINRTASWEDEFQMIPAVLGEQQLKRILLKGRPRLHDLSQGDLEAEDSIIAYLEQLESPPAEDAEVVKKKGDQPKNQDKKQKPISVSAEQEAAKPDPKAETKPPAGAMGGPGGNYRIVRLEAYDHAHLSKPGQDLTAIERLTADFKKPPKPDDAKPADGAESTADAKTKGEAVAKNDQTDASKTEKPETEQPKPEEPPPQNVVAVARRIDAKMLQAAGATQGTIETARLYGAVKVHQDPKPNEKKGSDVGGEAVEIASQGDGLMRFQVHRRDPRSKEHLDDADVPPAFVDTSDNRRLEGDWIVVDQKADRLNVPGPGKLVMITYKDILSNSEDDSSQPRSPGAIEAKRDVKADRTVYKPAFPLEGGEVIEGQNPNSKAKAEPKIITITWLKGMTFLGKPILKDGTKSTAIARFVGTVVASTDDSRIVCDDMETDFDQPVSFAKAGILSGQPGAPKRAKPIGPDDRADASKAGEALKPAEPPLPNPDILQVRCRGNADLQALTYYPDRSALENKRRITGDFVIYDKPSGHFWVEGKGIVRLYDRDKGDPLTKGVFANGAGAKPPAGRAPQRGANGPARNSAPSPARSNQPGRTRRTSAQLGAEGGGANNLAAAVRGGAERGAQTPQLAPLILTRIQFQQGMEGRFSSTERKANDNGPRQADFFGQVEMLRAKVEDEVKDLDPDRAPSDLVRLTSDVLQVLGVPDTRPRPAGEKAEDVTYAIAVGNAIANTNDKVIRAAKITHSSATDIVYCYPSPGGEVLMFQRYGNQEPARSSGKILKYNTRTREAEWTDSSNGVYFMEKGGRLGDPGPNIKKPKPPKSRLRRLTPSDKERESFGGS